MTIKKKLLMMNMAVIILSVTIFGAAITRIYEDNVNKRTIQRMADTNTVIADRITRILKDAENCSNYITVNINRLLNAQNASKELTRSQQRAITNELYVAKIVFDEINSIAFIDRNQQVFVSDHTLLVNQEHIWESTQLFVLRNTSGKSIWFPCELRDFLTQDATTATLTLGKKVLQIHTGETLGYIFINVDMGAIERILSNQLIHYWLEDHTGSVVSSVISSSHINETDVRELIHLFDASDIQRYKGSKYFVSHYEILEYDWRLIGITDLDELNIETRNIPLLVGSLAFVVAILELLLSHYLTRKITVPLEKLRNGAEEIAGGNMDLRLHFKTEDEIGQLGSRFNYMAQRVQELLVKVDFEARKKQEYELSLLHEQVKPHFLYNSLDIIIILSEMNRNKEARRAARKLADYYRNSLSDSKRIITIAQEIKIVEDYLELQRIRYYDVFTYEIDVKEDIMETLIPKLTLQPLIENAIYHGLKYKQEIGLLRISGGRTSQGIQLSVTDNGAGISEDILKSILKNQPEGHFGVYSVNHRIKLFFGEEYGIAVRSQPGEGTTVDILLPDGKSKEAKDYDQNNDRGGYVGLSRIPEEIH